MPSQDVGRAIVGVLMVALVIFAGLRLKRRRKSIGSAAAGTVYELLSEDKRRAVEIIVEGEAEKRRPEYPDDTDPPDHRDTANTTRKES